jgi:P-type E1-E2 ATPase
MIELDVPGRGRMQFDHLVSDVNGTLALDGDLMPGVAQRIAALKGRLTIHLLTADTHGKQAAIDQVLGLTAVRVEPGGEATQKAAFVRTLGSQNVIALGQGANDAEMLAEAGLGICVMSPEGVASESLRSANVIVPDILAAFDLLENPRRLVATLRK